MGILLNKSKNYVINGAMDFFQRDVSFVAVANNQYIADRFRYEKTGTMVHTVTRSTDVPTLAQSGFTFQSSIRLNLTTPQASLTTNQRCRVQTRIEGQIFAPLRLKTMTLTFWVKATLAGIYSVTFGDSSSSTTYIKDYVINASNTWEKKTITLTHSEVFGTWNYTTAVGLGVTFCLASGPDEKSATQDTWLNGDFKSSTFSVNGVQSGATDFYLTGVQLEEGTTSSNFERAGGNIPNEIRLCQRYFEKSWNIDTPINTDNTIGIVQFVGQTSSTAEMSMQLLFAAEKRTIPVVTIALSKLYPSLAADSTLPINVGTHGFTNQLGGGHAAATGYRHHWSADAEL